MLNYQRVVLSPLAVDSFGAKSRDPCHCWSGPWLTLGCLPLTLPPCRWNHGSNLFKFGVLSSRPSQTIPFSTLSSLAVFWGVDNGNLYMTTRTTNSKPTLLVELGSNEIFDTRNYTIHSPSGRTIHPFCLACQRCCGHWRAGGMWCVAKPAISAFGCIGESSDQLQSV